MELKMDGNGSADEFNYLETGDSMPEFLWVEGSGDPISSATFFGRHTLIVLFASGCRHCRNNTEYIQSQIIPNLGIPVNIIGFGRLCDEKDIESFKVRNHVKFKIIADPDSAIYSRFAEKAVPRNYLFDPEGKLILSIRGHRPEKIDLILKSVIRNNPD